MLKFFRKYNKWILAFGASILMVAFLMPVQSFTQGRESDYPIGRTADGRKVTFGDVRVAEQDMQIVQALSYGILPVPVRTGTRGEADALAWVLMLHDAEKLGLHASDQNVFMLQNAFGIADEQQLRQEAGRLRSRPEDIQRALRHWLISQRYQELMLGLSHVPLQEKLLQYQMVGMAMQAQRMDIGIRSAQSAQGVARLSQPLIQHTVSEQRARVRIEALPLDARHYLDQIEAPGEAAMQELFDQYKSNLAGESKPYGFGYRLPDRVKIEYFVLPLERVKQQVAVEEVDAYSYYEKNKASFVEVPEPLVGEDGQTITPEPRQREYSEVRRQIIDHLRDEQAERLASDILKAATLMLNDNARQLKSTQMGYKETEGFTPMSLADVAEKLDAQFGVRPDIVREDSRWLDGEALSQLPGIGNSFIPGDAQRMGVPFTQYVMSTVELQDESVRHPLATLRLQAKLPSQQLTSFTGDRYVFRLIEAQRARDPHNLDEVRDQVERDARRLAAYRKLLDERERWVNEVTTKSMTSLQLELGVELIKPDAFPRRVDAILSLQAPDIAEIGQDEAFVDAVFAIAERANEAGGVNSAPAETLVDAIPLDAKQQLLLVRLVAYTPITESNLELATSSPTVAASVLQAVVQTDEDDRHPLSREALIARTGYAEDTN